MVLCLKRIFVESLCLHRVRHLIAEGKGMKREENQYFGDWSEMMWSKL